MKPHVDSTEFGAIIIDGITHEKDILIRLDGAIKKRKKELSKAVYGTSHIISLDEAKHVYEKGAEMLIIGSGHEGMIKLSAEAEEYFQKKNCTVEIIPTPVAAKYWNKVKKNAIGLFHITC